MKYTFAISTGTSQIAETHCVSLCNPLKVIIPSTNLVLYMTVMAIKNFIGMREREKRKKSKNEEDEIDLFFFFSIRWRTSIESQHGE